MIDRFADDTTVHRIIFTADHQSSEHQILERVGKYDSAYQGEPMIIICVIMII